MLAAKRSRKGIKDAAQKPSRDLPGNASKEALLYRTHVRQQIDAGLTDIRTGRLLSHQAIRKEFTSSA
jgi:predicted transcriptional regulator